MSLTHNRFAEYTHWQSQETKIIDGILVRFSDICVHEFTVSDSEEPDIYAAEPIWEWQQSEAGQYIMAHAVEKPYYMQSVDVYTLGYRYRIVARLSEQDQVFWRLKWGGINK